MATATKRPVPSPAYEIVLTLSQQEAEALRAIFASCPYIPNLVQTTIYKALGDAGVDHSAVKVADVFKLGKYSSLLDCVERSK